MEVQPKRKRTESAKKSSSKEKKTRSLTIKERERTEQSSEENHRKTRRLTVEIPEKTPPSPSEYDVRKIFENAGIDYSMKEENDKTITFIIKKTPFNNNPYGRGFKKSIENPPFDHQKP